MELEQVQKYGFTCWANKEMDELRRKECLCYNCKLFDVQVNQTPSLCDIAAKGFQLCKETGIAFMVTRCPKFEKL